MRLAKIFFTALPAISKHLNRTDDIKTKLDYLYWLRKEMKNMIIEFNRIDAGLMYRISQESFSSRNKNLDSFIKIGVRALTHSNELTENNLYEYVKKQIKVREEIVVPQLDNEIEYYERIARTDNNQLIKDKTNAQKYSAFDFDYRKIRVEIDELPSYSKKKAYLLFLQKELNRVIRCFESERFTPWKVKAEDCSERNRFIEERYSIYNDAYRKDQHNIDKYVDEDIRNKTEELKDLAKAIDDEIVFVNAMSSIREGLNLEDFRTLWEELIKSNFDTKVLLWQFERIGDDREDEYIEYCARRFRHRTIEEWMRYFATKSITENIKTLKEADLSEELEYKNTIRITNAKFEESTLGQFTFQNLRSFEAKYIRTGKPYQHIEEKKDNIVSTVEDLLPQFKGLVNNKKELDYTKDQVEIKESEIDQDTLIEKFQKECERRKLQKGKTIPQEILYEIAKAIGMKVEKIEDFKSGEKNYQIARQYASLLKYKRKKPDER